MQSFIAGFKDTIAQRAEALKWIAATLMVYEHTWRYALGGFPAHVYIVGRVVFPLFVLAFAAGLTNASRESITSAIPRMLAWGASAAALGALVRDPVPLNVLFTFAAGTLLYCCASGIFHGRVWIALALLVASFGLEFGPLGVIAIAAAIAAFREHRPLARMTLGAVAAASLVSCNGTPLFAAIGVALALGLAAMPLYVPRKRGVFYVVYAAQWPLIAGIAWAATR